ncbi:hypothetical protein [Promicromonospora sp. NPDC060271]|uniref:hypothetical protein n=1 Tax=Promicromonospora sp. NPDC060271 TaxID=3347089 RepID=UPI0036649B75
MRTDDQDRAGSASVMGLAIGIGAPSTAAAVSPSKRYSTSTRPSMSDTAMLRSSAALLSPT